VRTQMLPNRRRRPGRSLSRIKAQADERMKSAESASGVPDLPITTIAGLAIISALGSAWPVHKNSTSPTPTSDRADTTLIAF